MQNLIQNYTDKKLQVDNFDDAINHDDLMG